MHLDKIRYQYLTGKILGRGTYAVVKEGAHIVTGEHYACKVINKQLVAGKEHMVSGVNGMLLSMSDCTAIIGTE